MSSEQGSGAEEEPLMSGPFDQTNGVLGGLDGDSDGTADSETERDGGVGISDTDDVSAQGAVDTGYIVGHQQ